jgi:prepilin-type N-terminal cleavage/methylation domain-containing protein
MKQWRSDKGYSLLETMMTLGIFGTVAAMAAFQIGSARPGFKGDGAMRTVIAQLNIARELAITQRRTMQIVFTPADEVQVIRENFPNGTTVISTVPIEGGIHYGLTTGLPDTPDNFGNSAPIYFGAAAQYRFTTEGTLVDQGNNPISGSVFLTLPGQERAARAVTILGATGRVRGYKWDGRSWKRV